MRNRAGTPPTPYEARILSLHEQGMTYPQIAEIVGRNVKSVDNALQRLRTRGLIKLTRGYCRHCAHCNPGKAA